jgi:hypothetical protein
MHERAFTITRAEVNDDGTFRAVLFTNGEASDGNILHIPGGQIPKRMPLFINHRADPTTQLGSIYLDSRDDDSITVRGEIMLEGEGESAEIRRDVFAKIRAGHVDRMSGRWDADDKHVTRRINLPKDHYAYVSDKDQDYRKRYGYFFEKWRGMEGSVVGLGADPQAVMRWAEDEESSNTVREFWRSMTEEEISMDPSDYDSKEAFIAAAWSHYLVGRTEDEAAALIDTSWENRKKDLEEPTEDLGKLITDLVKNAIKDEIRLEGGTKLSFDDLRQMKDLLAHQRDDNWVNPQVKTGDMVGATSTPPDLRLVEDPGDEEDDLQEAAVQTHDDSAQEPSHEGRLAAFGSYVREMVNSGLDPTDMREVIEAETAEHPMVALKRELAETKSDLATIKELLDGGTLKRVDEGDPLPPAPPAEDVAREIIAAMRQKAEEKAKHKLGQITKHLTDEVDPKPESGPTPGDIGRVLREELKKARASNLAEIRGLVSKAGGTGTRTSQADEIRDLVKRALKR